MARGKANEALRSKTKPNAVDELTRGIATLRELSVQIEDLSRDGFPYREAVRARTELSLRETIRRLFGEKSPEYQAHKHHKLKVGSRAESAQSTALLKECIAALEIQKAELLGLKPDEILALVAPKPDRPALTVVPPITSPDGPSASAALSPAPVGTGSLADSPVPAAIAAVPINQQALSLPPSMVAVVPPSATPPAADSMPVSSRDRPEPPPVPQSVSTASAPAEVAVVSLASGSSSPTAPSPKTTSTPSSTPPSTTNPISKAAVHVPVSEPAIPPVAPTTNAIPQGTMPPVPHTTLRPRPAPPVSTEFPSPTQPAVSVATTVTPPAPKNPEPSQPVASALLAPSAASGTVHAPDIRTAPPSVQALVETGPSPTPMLQQEPPPPPSVVPSPAPVRSAIPVSPEIRIPEKTPEAKVSAEPGTLDILRRVCARFHLVARQLRLRKEYRPTLEINDEYDLQDLFYALLRLQFDEVGTDEWTPAYTNGTPRTSYLLDWEKTVVVVKQTRSGLTTRDLAEQIAADTARYSARPNAATLVCFVYDPDGRVGNPRGLEADLSSAHGPFRIEVIVAPK